MRSVHKGKSPERFRDESALQAALSDWSRARGVGARYREGHVCLVSEGWVNETLVWNLEKDQPQNLWSLLDDHLRELRPPGNACLPGGSDTLETLWDAARAIASDVQISREGAYSLRVLLQGRNVEGYLHWDPRMTPVEIVEWFRDLLDRLNQCPVCRGSGPHHKMDCPRARL